MKSPAEPPPSTTVAYIGGIGRSGSTLLTRLLDRHAGTCGVGEVTHLWERGVTGDERCGCGRRFSGCGFWQQVGQRAFGGWDSPDAERARELRRRVDRNRYIPLMLAPRLAPRYRRRMREYGDALARLYAAIAQASGRPVVVDSSKHASTAFLLRRVDGVDLRVLHLVRDPRGVAHSWWKRVRRPEVDGEAYMSRLGPGRVGVRWLVYNVLFHLLAVLGVPTRFLRYERLAADPARTTTATLAWLGLDHDHVVTSEEVQLDPSHSVSGNPMRFQTGPVTVRPDDTWRTALPWGHRLVVALLTWPLRLAYLATGPRRAPADATRDEATPDARPDLEVLEEPPSVSVVIATRDRPLLLRRAVASALDQRYDGDLEVVVVFDHEDTDDSLERLAGNRRVRVVRNHRTPGLPGARNTGASVAEGELLAFCDDDDAWMPDKLARQVDHLLRSPGAVLSTTGIVIENGRRSIPRVDDRDLLTYEELLRDRVTTAHPSTYLLRREDFHGRVGEVDEAIPGGYGEDYDWLLRAARCGPIAVVREPLVHIRWGTTSFFADRWATMIEAIDYLVAKHPDLEGDPDGLARLYGRKAFAYAALGQRGDARTWAHRTLELNRRERRAYVALAVTRGLVSAETAMKAAHATGRGI